MPTKASVPISVLILAKNEEKRLPDCLASVTWAKEIMVLDDESTDRTVEIAQAAGAKIHHRAMDNEGRQRNFGIDHATQPWVLCLDADRHAA